jgi:hypothetical protein
MGVFEIMLLVEFSIWDSLIKSSRQMLISIPFCSKQKFYHRVLVNKTGLSNTKSIQAFVKVNLE